MVNILCQGFGGFAGVAYFPNGGPNDGTVIVSSYMNGTNSLLAHELGHGFNLYHTFNGDGGNVSCPANNDCTIDGDKIFTTQIL